MDEGASSKVYLGREIENPSNLVAIKIMKTEPPVKFDLGEFNMETEIQS